MKSISRFLIWYGMSLFGQHSMTPFVCIHDVLGLLHVSMVFSYIIMRCACTTNVTSDDAMESSIVEPLITTILYGFNIYLPPPSLHILTLQFLCSLRIQVLGHSKCNSAIRHVAISKNGRY